MQVTLEKTGDLQALIKVEVTPADYTDKVNKELKEIGRTRQIPGFRKGHVTLPMLRQRFGRDVKSHVLNEEVFNATINYIRENKLDVLGEPLPVNLQEIDNKDNDYTFEYEIGLAPEIDVDLAEVTVPYYTIQVTPDMVAEQDKALCKRFGAQVPGETFEPEALVKGAIMQLDADGNVLTTEDAIQVVDGIVAPMYFTDKEEAAKFEGKKVGDKVVFNPAKTCNGNVTELSSMLHIDKERAADVTSDFELAISEIIVLRPAEHGEEFYKEVFPGAEHVTDEAAYNEELAKMIARQLAPNSEQMFQRDARTALMNKFGNFDLPSEFLKKWLVARNEGLTAENVDAEYEKMIPSIKWELLRGRIVAKQDIKVNEDDLLAYAKSIAYNQFAQYGMTNLSDDVVTDYAKRMLSEKEYAPRLREDVTTIKMFNAVKASVKLDQQEVSLDRFKELAAQAPEA